MLTRSELVLKLSTDDRWLERGVLAIWRYQTTDEQRAEVTKERNYVGFNGCDGEIMTSFGNQLAVGRHLSEKQKAIARRKMPKYAGQLLKIAEGNNE